MKWNPLPVLTGVLLATLLLLPLAAQPPYGPPGQPGGRNPAPGSTWTWPGKKKPAETRPDSQPDAAAQGEEATRTTFEGQVLRILPPPGRRAEGRVEIEALPIDPAIAEIVFFVDGERAGRSNRPPWSERLVLASPPREQTITARAYDDRGAELGEDSVVVNRPRHPLRLRITAVEGNGSEGVELRFEVSVPANGRLQRVELYLGDALVETLMPASPSGELAALTARLQPAGAPPAFVRAVAVLEDGRTVEDVEPLGTGSGLLLQEEVDVHLVQLQALVTLENGQVLTQLERDDFDLLERGKERPIDQLLPAGDVSLALGLVLDSSGSMRAQWRTALDAARQFLGQVMDPQDEAFLVDFDQHVRLAQPLTQDLPQLLASLERLRPEGSTALFDAILFSLLQFEDTPGRRALVVVTDGYDAGSSSDPERVVEYGRKLGVPIYVIALPAGGQGPGPGLARGQNDSYLSQTAPVHSLKLLTDPTGGRLLRVGPRGGLDRAFQQIGQELRSQYVLTYYSELPLGEHEAGDVTVRVKEPKGAQVRALLALDQVN